MTHRHALRRGVTPRQSDAHLRVWSRLLKRASALGDCGNARALPFVKAAVKARSAVAPVGYQDAQSPFIRLVRIGLGFLALGLDDRRAQAAIVADLCLQCREVMVRAAGDTPVRAPRERRDIDG